MFLNSDVALPPNQKSAHLFGTSTQQLYNDSIIETLRYIQTFLNRDCFYTGDQASNFDSKKQKISVDSIELLSLKDALSEIKDIYLDHTIDFQHPSYVAHLNCPVLLPAIAADLLATSVNTAVETWDQSTSATLIEQEVIRWICSKLHLPKKYADGVFTSGGTQSNFMALCLARDDYAFKHYGLNLKENGWSDIVSRFRFFCSDKAHFSLQKNAALLGMGYHSVIAVATDSRMKIKPEALVQAIEKEKQLGHIPIGIVATAGTTDYGSFDPLLTLSKIAKEYNVWFHIDAAYGGCFALAETHCHLLEGTEFADSITIDFHKSMFQPVCCSAFLVKDTRQFKYISHHADYLNPLEHRDEERPNLIEKSIQTTRRFDALKVWFTLKTVGAEKIGSFLEKVHYLALDLYHSYKDDPNFECIHKPELSTLVFRYKAPGIESDALHDTINLHIKNTLFKSGKASVASTRHNGILFLKFTLLNPQSTLDDLLHIMRLIKETGRQYTNTN